MEQLWKWMRFLFGSPTSQRRFHMMMYKAAVTLYVSALLVLSGQAVFADGGWASVVVFAVLFPIIFRIVNGANRRMLYGEDGRPASGLRLSVFMGLPVVVIFALVVLFDGGGTEGVTIEVGAESIDAELAALHGPQLIHAIEVSEDAAGTLTYEAAVEEGTIVLFTEQEEEAHGVVELSGEETGELTLPAGEHEVYVSSEKAEGVALTIAIPDGVDVIEEDSD
ncbi:hypothetical protein [Salsuginibacillus kocurii]|uniref:hypothetical protein n=1 Tax=Salsuginibacillus kocurii TaxID=427078 RepID=UPI0003731E60|nr:hypothetical protein [Salsuginibacillus kocurii]